jgi:hypothetical protein
MSGCNSWPLGFSVELLADLLQAVSRLEEEWSRGVDDSKQSNRVHIAAMDQPAGALCRLP